MHKLLFLSSVLVFTVWNAEATKIEPDGKPLAKKTHALCGSGDDQEKRRKKTGEYDSDLELGVGHWLSDPESSSDVSSDDCLSDNDQPQPYRPSNSAAATSSQQPASLGSLTDDERPTLSFHQSIGDDEVRDEPPRAEDTMHEVGNTLYFVNSNGLITAKMRGDGEMINVAHENKFWSDDHSETEDESDSETGKQDT